MGYSERHRGGGIIARVFEILYEQKQEEYKVKYHELISPRKNAQYAQYAWYYANIR